MSIAIRTNEIVDQMKFYWVNMPAPKPPTFYFGWPQEVDNIHAKNLPALILNPPEITVSTKSFMSNTILTNSNWTLTIYDVIPSAYNVTDDLRILDFWDAMEDGALNWIYNWWYYYENILGIEFVLTSPIKIVRTKEASNDRLLALQISFGFDFYRLCANTQNFPNIEAT